MATPARPGATQTLFPTPSSGGSTGSTGTWTKEARQAKAADKVLLNEMLEAALEWMRTTGHKSTKAAKEFPPLTASQIDYAVKKGVNHRTQYSILTDREMQQLADWCINSARNINPAKLMSCQRKRRRSSSRGSSTTAARSMARAQFLLRKPRTLSSSAGMG